MKGGESIGVGLLKTVLGLTLAIGVGAYVMVPVAAHGQIDCLDAGVFGDMFAIDRDPSPCFTNGQFVNFTWSVTNKGTQEITWDPAQVGGLYNPPGALPDMNYIPILASGDTDFDGKQDPGEVWIYTNTHRLWHGQGSSDIAWWGGYITNTPTPGAISNVCDVWNAFYKAPVLVCPPPTQLVCNSCSTPNCTGVASAVDPDHPECPIEVSLFTYTDQTAPGGGCTQIITRTWMTVDAFSSTSTCDQTITTLVDTNPPTIICPANTSFVCNAICLTTNCTGTATATDDCLLTGMWWVDVTNRSGACILSIARTWWAEDICSNRSSCVQTIDVLNNPPVVSCPPPAMDCNLCLTTNCRGVATATDDCTPSNQLVITYSDSAPVNIGGCTQVISRTWRATDSCGAQGLCVQSMTNIADTLTPRFTFVPPNLFRGCGQTIPTNYGPGSVTVSDDCAYTVTHTQTRQFVDFGLAYQIVVSNQWTATDLCDHVSKTSQVVVLQCQVPCKEGCICPDGSTNLLVQFTNPWFEPLMNVQVVTDFAGSTASNINANWTYVSGDNNLNGLQDPGETWTFSAQITNIQDGDHYAWTLTGNDAAGVTVTLRGCIDFATHNGLQLIGVPGSQDLPCIDIPAPPIVRARWTMCNNEVSNWVVRPQQTVTELPPGSGITNVVRTWTATNPCGGTVTGTQVITLDCHCKPRTDKIDFMIHLTAGEPFFWYTNKKYDRKDQDGIRTQIPDFANRKGFFFIYAVNSSVDLREKQWNALQGQAVLVAARDVFSYNALSHQGLNVVGDGVLNLDGVEYCTVPSEIALSGFAANLVPGLAGKLVICSLDPVIVPAAAKNFGIHVSVWNQDEVMQSRSLFVQQFRSFDLNTDMHMALKDIQTPKWQASIDAPNPLWAVFYQEIGTGRAWGGNVWQVSDVKPTPATVCKPLEPGSLLVFPLIDNIERTTILSLVNHSSSDVWLLGYMIATGCD